MRIKFVEHAFDQNDWFVIIGSLILYAVMLFLPAKLSRSTTVLSMLFSVTFASIFDNTTGYLAFDFYDIMDGPAVSVMDYPVYFLYAPFGYFFMYFYERLNLNGVRSVYYMLFCSAAAVMFERLCVHFHVFHYKHGYSFYISFVIYLFVQACALWFYRWIK